MSTRVNHNENKNTYTITYTFADGTTSVVEVSEDIANVVIDLDHREELAERRETRRHCSIHTYDPDGTRIADDTDFVRDLIENEEYALLHQAIAQLSERHKHLIYEVYFNNRTYTEIAETESKNPSTIMRTTKLAVEDLKKILKNF